LTVFQKHYEQSVVNNSASVGERSIAISLLVCVSVSVREHISGTAGPIFTKFVVQIPCGCGSVLLLRRCATLCTSGLWTTSCLVVVGRILYTGPRSQSR